MDKINRQVAARIVSSSAFTALKDYDLERAQMMREQLTRISAENGLSENVFEIVSKSLASYDYGPCINDCIACIKHITERFASGWWLLPQAFRRTCCTIECVWVTCCCWLDLPIQSCLALVHTYDVSLTADQ